jgi:hypothetical protein
MAGLRTSGTTAPGVFDEASNGGRFRAYGALEIPAPITAEL